MTTDLAKQETYASEVLTLARGMRVETQTQVDTADRACQQVVAMFKEVDGRRQAENRPHLDAKEANDKKYAKVCKALKECEKILRAKITDALRAQREREHQERLALQESLNSAGADADASDIVLAHGRAESHIETPQGFREESELSFEVTDEAAVPIEYKRTYGPAVMAEIERTRGACQIPGIRVIRTLKLNRKGVVHGA